ncbi:MAG: ATP-binding cassette domain-containing protein [Lentisphaerae bacterium]|jgi:ABC-type nitrate/sulfonate/bicarbonate transport system ATPase subunit|nr:ATP-binding cassette domain-containing protein [Lentisphaerota bacterium]MBT4823062.1 ATP-binding cassette domain-containing protein [Lentisphaerota bacterium]MBT5610575.1 ATP-binding cassette domain-containing protein [Lentisphaerota bacterium]MBT7060169.1 ATP-binding cassette domain-containing protein [Lentisphaerota bacterium]MBT7844134.1 ATP-binding cassette domain-containing protein [Lentisphaerota bacterium]
MLRLTNVTKSFDGKPVLAGVSLRCSAGELVCLHGPSGCGKTTILNIAARTVRPDSGRVLLHTARVGFVFQEDRLLPWLTVLGNLTFSLSGYVPPEEAASLAEEWLERLGVSEARDQRPGALSGGMRRRINLARALAIQPTLLLLDEPFAFLDPRTATTVRDELATMRERQTTTILMVSHVLEHVLPLEPRVIETGGSPITIPAP